MGHIYQTKPWHHYGSPLFHKNETTFVCSHRGFFVSLHYEKKEHVLCFTFSMFPLLPEAQKKIAKGKPFFFCNCLKEILQICESYCRFIIKWPSLCKAHNKPSKQTHVRHTLPSRCTDCCQDHRIMRGPEETSGVMWGALVVQEINKSFAVMRTLSK